VVLAPHPLCAGSTVPHLVFIAVYESVCLRADDMDLAALELAAAVQGTPMEGLPLS
jgi:hypothetical protein